MFRRPQVPGQGDRSNLTSQKREAKGGFYKIVKPSRSGDYRQLGKVEGGRRRSENRASSKKTARAGSPQARSLVERAETGGVLEPLGRRRP